jgi:hypothetical protein
LERKLETEKLREITLVQGTQPVIYEKSASIALI